MIVGTKRDMVMGPQSLANVNERGYVYIGSLCAQVDHNFRMLPQFYVGGFIAYKLGNAYCVSFGRESGEPEWADGEHDVTNIDILVRKGKHNG